MNRARPSGPVLALIVIVGIGVVLLVTAGLQNTVVYYRTPTEVKQSTSSVGQTVRLGGRVQPGSLHDDGGSTEFELSDGRSAVLVQASEALPDTFREGQDAVVEGVLEPNGTFRARTVAVKHSNEYRAPRQDIR